MAVHFRTLQERADLPFANAEQRPRRSGAARLPKGRPVMVPFGSTHAASLVRTRIQPPYMARYGRRDEDLAHVAA